MKTAVPILALALLTGCGGRNAPDPATQPAKHAATAPARATTAPATRLPETRAAAEPADPPTYTAPSPATLPAGGDKRFVTGSPFDTDYVPPAKPSAGKQMWAKSVLWQEAPELHVEQWLTDEPETEGKFRLIEFWATWCPPCRRSIPLLNRLHKRFGADLAVIGISHESADDVRALKGPEIEYYSAVDTQARTKKALGVVGIPHVILVEPGGVVIWEGFPLLKGYELTEGLIERALAASKAAETDSGR